MGDFGIDGFDKYQLDFGRNLNSNFTLKISATAVG